MDTNADWSIYHMPVFGDHALSTPSGPSFPSDVQSLDMPLSYSSQSSNGLGGVFFDTQALGGFQSQGMFGDLSAYSSPNSSQQIGVMPRTPISAPFTNRQEPTVATVTASMIAGQAVSDISYGLGLPQQAPTSFFHYQQQHYSPVPLGTVSSAPPNMFEFTQNVLHTQSAADERHVSASPYCSSAVAPHTPAPAVIPRRGKASTVRRTRTSNGMTEHRYRRSSELMATERIAGAVGASSAGGNTANRNSNGLSSGVRSVSSTVAGDPGFRFEHVFAVNAKAQRQAPKSRRPAAAAIATSALSLPCSSAANPADVVKPELLSSMKRTRKDNGQPTKRRKQTAKAEGVVLEGEHDGKCSQHKCEHPDCDKSFSRPYNLVSHLRTHSDERPYPCGQCEQRFSRNHDLKRHVKIHSGERPFICPICLRTFARADVLARHTSNVTACKRVSGSSTRNRRATTAAQGANPDALVMPHL
ncbi:hypothetical protein GGI19_000080 [Coemansia pectinata]|uniref:C2H2-type domain-containing protein n=1 Tax=Coemansia pectinata TaxID=1052879 RepID=A0A9W8H0T4_9FUNG|nr:hypothetical protein GGI19_000080 [Coemansia pectinata]